MINPADIFAKISEMQENLKKTREKLNDVLVDADAGGGMVRVTANANKRIVRLVIEPEVLKDKEMTEDLICAAINKALELADERGKAELAKASAEIIPFASSIPGLDLSKLGL